MAIVAMLCAASLPVSGADKLPESIHWPVHGDKVEKVHYEFMGAAVDTTVWDFSRIRETGIRHDVRWLNYGDSLLTRIENGGQETYRCSNDSVFLISTEDNLIRLAATGLRAQVWPEICAQDILRGTKRYEGIFSGGRPVDTKGVVNVTVLGVGCLILPMDTLYNVKRIRTEVTETINVRPGLIDIGIYGDTIGMRRDSLAISADSLLHTVIKDRWYSDCHRYELVENTVETYTWAGNDISTRSTTCLIAPEAQEYQFGILKTRPGRPTGHEYAQPGTRNVRFSLADNLTFSHSGTDICVSFSSSGSKSTTCEISLLLYDSAGRVWQNIKDSIHDGYWSQSMSTMGLPPGKYVVTLTADSQKQSYKFNIN